MELVTEEGLPKKPGLDARAAFLVHVMARQRIQKWAMSIPVTERLKYGTSLQTIAGCLIRQAYLDATCHE